MSGEEKGPIYLGEWQLSHHADTSKPHAAAGTITTTSRRWLLLLAGVLTITCFSRLPAFFLHHFSAVDTVHHDGRPPVVEVDISKVPLGEIKWHQCPQEIDGSKFECGHLSAPLDHLNTTEDARRASIYITRFKARSGSELTPRKDVLGTIILNPGGPGGSGVSFMTTPRPSANNLTFSELFNQITKGRYDYLSFDPRGVGRTWPRASCWKDAADSCLNEIFVSTQGMYRALPGGEDAQVGEMLSEMELRGAVCGVNEETKESLRYVGTTAVARDMRLMYTAVGDPGLNYWGFSYGTVLGSTFADMFPDEVNRVAIDGVVNVTDYYLGRWASTMVNTDETFYGFIKECAKAGDSCALTRGLSSSGSSKKQRQTKDVEKSIHKKIAKLFDHLSAQPTVVANATHPGLLTWSMLKGTIFQALYSPVQWNALAEDLQQLVEGNAVPFYEKHGLKPCDTAPALQETREAVLAIACGDVKKRFDNLPTASTYKKLIKEHESLSKYFGGMFVEAVACQGAWPIHTNEPWKGDFTSKTANPILLLGNSYDPVTPHANAEYHARKFPNSAYVLRTGYGHCTISQKSRCAEKVIADYFIEGKVPKKGTVCPWDSWDQPIFHGTRGYAISAAAVESLEDGGAGRLLTHAAAEIAAFAPRGRLW
ncbi:hypothetical protein K437DRAFT_259850 [Tilletiaria anomala UBC 951]|uniref:Alpha/beta-hydrolase n=1 Tax=Tilletiaria anomala (strain ATCC 24038 / CBS 436.72 / UBC 951) TaxID=1037660 RepID=A0A066VF88_TILAU|nr:uncharacterized protein K437DRAFT_259850 [Tilletiaria anomala UBC 951]KDN37255.1 hypothetical protein K437DRAFT_259850 [Tilletiaria anomala UBC 951]